MSKALQLWLTKEEIEMYLAWLNILQDNISVPHDGYKGTIAKLEKALEKGEKHD